jgi:hypothetical protein
MPAIDKAGGSAFRKDVEFVAKDADEQVASGIVMVPDKVDLQGDFAREETIRDFADQFEAFYEADEASGGVMHAVFPDEWMDLERNEVLDEAETIGGVEAPAGAWVQDWHVTDGETWALVEDGILEGYSIGAIQVAWSGPMEEDGLPDDVAVADGYDGGMGYWELVDGLVQEVSTVDIPAVPDAEILETKADADKRLGDYLGDRDGFLDEAMQRGHSEAEAERLWDLLNRAMEVDGAADPGKSVLSRVRSFLSRSDDDTTTRRSEAPGRDKEGQTLSQANREAVMASIDAGLDVLHDAGVEDLPKRFTDRDDVDFDIGEHDGRTWPAPDGDDGDGDDEDDDSGPTDVSADNDAPAGDTADDDTTSMSDTDGGDDKALAEKNAEQIDELTDAVKDLTDAVEDDGGDTPDADKTAEVELPSGEVAEVSKDEAMSWFDGDDTVEADVDTDGDETADLEQELERLHQRLDAITRQSGTGSTQLDDGGNTDDSGLKGLGEALS